MTLQIVHPFVNLKADGVDTTVVRPSDWNDDHTITLAAGKVLGRDTSGAGAAQELPLSFTSAGDATFTATGAVKLTAGTTAQRPGTPLAGMERWNTTLAVKEIYDGANWVPYALEAAITAAIAAAVAAAVPTGSIRPCLKLTADTGWVRLNGLTIGSASSAATERANADCETLFKYLWDNLDDTRAPVSGGRGVSATADWASNKRITLPSSRDRVLVGMATMGSTDAALISLFDTTIMGNTGGDEAHTHTATADTAPGVWGIVGNGPAASSHTHVITVANGKAIPPALVVCVQIKL
jgi:hypothetical protein